VLDHHNNAQSETSVELIISAGHETFVSLCVEIPAIRHAFEAARVVTTNSTHWAAITHLHTLVGETRSQGWKSHAHKATKQLPALAFSQLRQSTLQESLTAYWVIQSLSCCVLQRSPAFRLLPLTLWTYRLFLDTACDQRKPSRENTCRSLGLPVPNPPVHDQSTVNRSSLADALDGRERPASHHYPRSLEAQRRNQPPPLRSGG
jgi:hypothetical protein